MVFGRFDSDTEWSHVGLYKCRNVFLIGGGLDFNIDVSLRSCPMLRLGLGMASRMLWYTQFRLSPLVRVHRIARIIL
jgi:hypothetical protein